MELIGNPDFRGNTECHQGTPVTYDIFPAVSPDISRFVACVFPHLTWLFPLSCLIILFSIIVIIVT